MDSTSQTGHDGADWQQEIYLKIQAMKEAHLAELQELYLTISQRYERDEMLPHEKRPHTFEKLKTVKLLVERLIALLQISKSNITINLKDELPSSEKKILELVNTFRRLGPKQLQHPVGHAQSTPQHQPSQVLQVQQHENHGNQVLPSAVTSRMQHGSMTLATLADPATQQNATNSVQSASELDHGIRMYQLNLPASITTGKSEMTSGMQHGSMTTPTPAAQQTNLNNLDSSMDSTAQRGHNGADWQEEIYLKIQAMRKAHLVDLRGFHMKVSLQYEQALFYEILPHTKRPANFEKLKIFTLLSERLIAFLHTSKSDITINHKDKLPLFEKQLLEIVNAYRSQGKQQLLHPVLQAQQHENHENQVMLSALTSRLQHGSTTLATLADPATHQNATNSVQSTSQMDHGIRTYQLDLPASSTTMQSEVTSGMQHGSMTTPTSAAPPSRVQQLLSSLPFINWIGSK